MIEYFTLDEHGFPVLEPDKKKWDEWKSATMATRIAQTWVRDIIICTIFISFIDTDIESLPNFWETIIHYPDGSKQSEKCSGIRIDAYEMHWRNVAQTAIQLLL